VYPNPNSGRFSIGAADAIRSVEIFNLQGERIFRTVNEGNRDVSEIDISTHVPGIYFLAISDGIKRYVRKIVVQ
jgi:hypothetical protein